MTTLPTPGGDVGTWGDELNLWLETSEAVYNVELDPYNAVPDEYFSDGVTTASDATFTSATAAFTGADVGKTVVIEKGRSLNRPLHTTIASVTNSTTVELSHTASRSGTGIRFVISRSGDQTAAIQEAIDAAHAAGGDAAVYLPGPGYLVTGLVIKNRVHLVGAGRRNTLLHLAASSNSPVIQTYASGTDRAQFITIRDLMIDGNADRQAHITSTVATTQYDPGETTLTLTDASNFAEVGALLIGTNRLVYNGKSGNVLQNVNGGVETTTDAIATIGTTVTNTKSVGILLRGQDSPTEANVGTSEHGDNHFHVHDVIIRETKGDGLQMWGHSECRVNRVFIQNAYEIGVRMTFDSWISEVTVQGSGRAGIHVANSSIRIHACKVFNAGSVESSKGFGFLLEHATIPAEGGVVLIGCEAQDNQADGFFINQADRVSITACQSSSNGAGGTNRHGLGAGDGTYVGLKMAGANYCLIDMTSTDHGKNGSPGAYQTNALYLDSASNHNQIRLTHGRGANTLNEADFLRVVRSDSDLSGGNHLVINGQEGATTVASINNTGTVTATAATNLLTRATHGLTEGDIVLFTTTTTLPAPLALNTPYYVISSGLTTNDFKVSTTYNGTEVDITTTGSGTHTMWEGYLPDPYKATSHRMTLAQANTPISLPLRAHLGAELIFIIKQDATGSRAVVFDPAYITNGAKVNDEPNAYSKLSFYYDGTSWLTTERVAIAALAANATANATTTGVKISGLDLAGVGAGRYAFEYLISYQAAATTTGVKFGVNHTGASSAVVVTSFWPGVGTTAITVSDTDQVANTFQLVGHLSARSMSTTSPNLGPTTAVDTANADNLVVIKGILTVTNTGTLELWHGSEVAAASTVMAGSSVTLIKLT